MKLNAKYLVLNSVGAKISFSINKVLLQKLGIEKTLFITYLIEEFTQQQNEGIVKEDLSFHVSDFKISSFTTIPEYKINEIKKSLVKKELLKIKEEGTPVRSYYCINFDKLLEIMVKN